MKRKVLSALALSAVLLTTACGAHGPVSKDGVATSDQMNQMDKITRAFAAEKYDDAAAAGYKAFGASSDAKNMEYMTSTRKKSSETFDKIKAAYDKGCYLVADKTGRYREIESLMKCDNGDDPKVSISFDGYTDTPYNISVGSHS